MRDETNRDDTSGDAPVENCVSRDFAGPLGSTTSGRMVFASAAAGVRIDATTASSDLYRAHFACHIPNIRLQDGIITIHYRRHLPLDHQTYPGKPLAQISLNALIPWEIEFHQGVSRLTADLSQLQLAALDLTSVSTALFRLPAPAGSTNIYLAGSASDLTLQRPPGVAIRLQIAGSASHITLDHQRFGALAGGLHWQTQDYPHATQRYAIDIAGSISNLAIETWRG
jgi:hypothetical protein